MRLERDVPGRRQDRAVPRRRAVGAEDAQAAVVAREQQQAAGRYVEATIEGRVDLQDPHPVSGGTHRPHRAVARLRDDHRAVAVERSPEAPGPGREWLALTFPGRLDAQQLEPVATRSRAHDPERVAAVVAEREDPRELEPPAETAIRGPCLHAKRPILRRLERWRTGQPLRVEQREAEARLRRRGGRRLGGRWLGPRRGRCRAPEAEREWRHGVMPTTPHRGTPTSR